MQIQQNNASSLQGVFRSLNWKTKSGCASCVPAITYYLAMIYPENEGAYEIYNQLKTEETFLENDGTYSVIPQMYGGKTSASDLQRIASVVEKYQISDVGITS